MPWKPGESGNPAGRKPGTSTHQTLSKAYLRALERDFRHHGAETISKLRERDPGLYCKLIARLVPRSLLVEKQVTHQFVIDATPELTLEQWRKLHELKPSEIKHLEHIQ